jgi:PleD family two-component response regulator
LPTLIDKQVTLSIGVATGTLSNLTMDDILMNSDRAVYTSKETGRNRFTHFDDIE